MASYARCLFFLLLAFSYSIQTHARDSKFFNKLTKNTKQTASVSNVQAPTLAPSPSPEPEPVPVEHGYGLYGQDPYEYPPTTKNPTKTPVFDEEFSHSKEFEHGNGYVSEKQGMSDTRFLEHGKYYYDVSQDNVNRDEIRGNGYGNQEKQGMSDTRFLENGKYFYDINNDKQENAHFNTNNNENENENENENYQTEKQGLSDTRFLENGKYYYDVNNEEKGENGHFNTNNDNKNFETEKQGMSDTRFLENGKYYYDVSNEEKEAKEDEKLDEFDDNKYENENENENENGKFGAEKQGMSDTRYLENGKYYYDINNEKENNNLNYKTNNNHGNGDVGFHNNDNIEYANKYNGNNNNEYETQGYNYNHNNNEYHAKQGSGGFNYPKKFPKYEYDSMEEYDREHGYIDANVP